MKHAENSLVQVDFTSPEGRKERLWAESIGTDQARILSVPVWIYGVSVGSIVHTGTTPARVTRTSPGATLRFLVAEGMSGKHVYLTRVVPDLRERNWGIGPATFFGPRLVALNVHTRASWWPEIGGYLDGLRSAGMLEQWEAGDPDQDADQESAMESSTESILVHPLPVDGTTDLEFS